MDGWDRARLAWGSAGTDADDFVDKVVGEPGFDVDAVLDPNRDTVTLLVMLWPKPGADAALTAYEDQVLLLIPDHGGVVLQRVRNERLPADEDHRDEPLEVHVIRFPNEDALQSYMEDPRRTIQAQDRDRAIARTRVIRVRPV